MQASLRASRAMSAAGRSAPTRWWGPGPAAPQRRARTPDDDEPGLGLTEAGRARRVGLPGAGRAGRLPRAEPELGRAARRGVPGRVRRAAPGVGRAVRRGGSGDVRRRTPGVGWAVPGRVHHDEPPVGLAQAEPGPRVVGVLGHQQHELVRGLGGVEPGRPVLGVGAVEPGQPGVAAQLGGEPVGEPTDERGRGAVERDEGEHGVGVDGHGRCAAGDARGEVADQRAGRAGVGEQHVEVGPAHGVQLRVPAGAHGRVARLAGEQRELAEHLAAARLPHHLAVDDHLQPSVPDDVEGVTGVTALEQHRARGQRHRTGQRRQLVQPRVGQAGEERYLPQQRGLLVHGCDHGACQVRSSTPTPGSTRRTCTRHGSTRATTKPGAVGPSQPGTPMAPGS